VDARAGIGVTDEQQELVTSPKSFVPEHLVSPGAAPVRRLPIGAEPQLGGGVHFRLWAPRCREVVVEIEGLNPAALQPEIGGYFSLWSLPARAGMRYRFRLDRGERAFPDPASRFQPEGPHGPSEIVDPGDVAWTDDAWRGRTREQLVIYEMHVGTFTPDGSWEAASRELPVLAELGITCLEIMPVAEFPGRFGWGYDGVNLFAPTRLYGRPTDFRRLVRLSEGPNEQAELFRCGSRNCRGDGRRRAGR
jgi:maltooligosyltrehalose trehalohydrolase